MRYVGWFVVGSLTMVASILLRGYVLVKLWYWFAVPAFHLPTLSIPLALGLAIIVGIFRDDDKRSGKDKFITSFVQAVVQSLFALLIGFIVHLFV